MRARDSLSLVLAGHAYAASTLLHGGTIIAFDAASNGLRVVRDGSLLVTDDRIAGIYESGRAPNASDHTRIDVAGRIITPGFVDTHRHGWQTGLKTLASNTSLWEYFGRYSEFAAAGALSADDVYVGQLAGQLEALHAGVTTTLDHAHHTWSPETSDAGLRGSIDSGARVFWSYAFHKVANFTVEEQLDDFRGLAARGAFKGTPTSLGVAYDSFGPDPDVKEVESVVSLAKEFNVSVFTTHALEGPLGITNSPTDLDRAGLLFSPIPVVISHASFLSYDEAELLRKANQYVSITPESEMHFGHTHPRSHLVMDQAALGVDTHMTFSTDILTQARIWLQKVRYTLYEAPLQQWRVPSNNPMSAVQAFLLATRSGGLALRRDDLGVIAEGAKADLVVWDGTSPAMLGWNDPVAAVMLHASVGDVEHVLVDGRFVKRDGRLTHPDYPAIRERFLQSARRLQGVFAARPKPVPAEGERFANGRGGELVRVVQADVVRGEGNGYGSEFVSTSG